MPSGKYKHKPNSGSFKKGSVTLPKHKQKCALCGVVFMGGTNQIFCGSFTKKIGCSWENRKNKRSKNGKQGYDKRRNYYLNYQKNWVKNNKEKVAAQIIVHQAIKNGILKRRPCEMCGNPKSHGHHDDYSKPLKVMWLCSSHHRLLHQNNINS